MFGHGFYMFYHVMGMTLAFVGHGLACFGHVFGMIFALVLPIFIYRGPYNFDLVLQFCRGPHILA